MLSLLTSQPGRQLRWLFLGLALLSFQSNLWGFNPVVDLGPDINNCGAGNVTLDAGNAGATFLWSTGAISQSISVSTDGLYWVQVTDGTGTSRDSINVLFVNVPTSPVLSDTSVCLGESIPYLVPEDAEGVLWYDSLTGGNILGAGNSFTYTPTATQTLYAAQYNRAPAKIGMPDTSFGSITYRASNNNGIIFSVFSPVKLNAVHTYTDGPVSFNLTIEDNSGTVIHTQAVSISSSFERTKIQIDVELESGDYIMRGSGFSGGGGLAISNLSTLRHPYTIADAITLISGVTAHPPNRFWFFYDWEVDVPTCFSPRAASQITILETPQVELGQDTIICSGNTFVLDATNANASYLWSDGSTNPTFTVTETSEITVVASIGTCLASDEIEVFVFDVPGQSSLNDTSICGPQEITLNNNMDPVPEFTFWWSEMGELLEIAPSFTSFIGADTRLEVENVNSRSIQIGPEDLTISTRIVNDGFSTRGIRVNALQDMVINTIAVFPISTNDVSFDIVLKDANAIEISRHPQTVSPPYSKEILDVEIFVPKGDGYSLEVQNMAGGNLFRSVVPAESYPFLIDNVASISSATVFTTTNTLTQYNYLYDLSVIPYETACKSVSKPIEIRVNLPLQFQDSIYSCTDLVLDPGFSAASYTWSTGASSPSITVSETGTYILTVSDGASCQVVDSSFVEIPNDAGLADDGILCGNVLNTNYGPSASFMWNTGATTPTLNVTTPGTYSVEVTEPRGCTLTDTIVISGFDTFPIVDLGQDQSACENLLLDAGNPGLTYEWSTGETSQQITVASSGLYSVIVSNANDCATNDTIGVSITPLPVAQFAVPDTVAGGVNRRVNFVNQSSFGSYLWKFGDGNSSNQISPSYTYVDTGTYNVELIVTDIQNNCGTDTFRKTILVLQYPVGIDNGSFGTPVRVFPNPAQSKVQIEFESAIPGKTQCEIFNLQGHAVLSQEYQVQSALQTETLNIEHLSPGIYMLYLKNKDQVLTHKIIVQ